ncbi:hypothetical protein OU995_21740 [Roseateles sp. SL47]|uniref:hypothetical protein n=1 Tax=Roseateles sp. SL47 TaxID=2995138 RepID=UPI00226DC4C0|nr:hypothetical protein [Roseateles sp. SL47]WAC72158.1 hypothetical protein OU995_21740 [Roseateles sp. SL47]
MSAMSGVAEAIAELHPADVADKLNARRIQAQTKVLARMASAAFMLAALAVVLMSFPRAKQLGPACWRRRVLPPSPAP